MKPRFALWVTFAVVVVILDQLTKQLMLNWLHEGDAVPMTDFFSLVLLYNRGAAFSFLAEHSGWQRWFFVGLAGVICLWLLRLTWRHQRERLQPFAFALIIGGAIGNVVDRLWHGAVVDFLYFHAGRYGWPAFNLADSAIFLGVCLMLWAQLRDARRQSAQENHS
ncbi:lipoprotein signal peptidase [Nitrogeniibacter mangrovi]|uniref:Lipoprotein signal peptidase n=1 Tax=Nitrogeniibacter mangrovi TaxID=2016596 RepID=A0A6C1B4P2_9RHOO|nr:signal peptidase II [Nitrogeniibacter mangrovi]QID18676.1 lipoprotein signal peptidase [Nitrogeniibacter mangrovi]